MKKKKYSIILSLLLILSMLPTEVYAKSDKENTIADEKLKKAFELMKENQGDVELTILPNGRGYEKKIYDLGDGCQLIMEFEDGADSDTMITQFIGELEILPLATNGETMWKDYGKRYFTATATVTVESISCKITLENHYTLSASGVDENYGVPTAIVPADMLSDIYGPYTLAKSAREKGAEVSMYANYMIKGDTTSAIMLTTAVQYVDHNISTGQIKVKHSWSLK